MVQWIRIVGAEEPVYLRRRPGIGRVSVGWESRDTTGVGGLVPRWGRGSGYVCQYGYLSVQGLGWLAERAGARGR
jgi:hypothetical protein